jgi:hypothetical protein
VRQSHRRQVPVPEIDSASDRCRYRHRGRDRGRSRGSKPILTPIPIAIPTPTSFMRVGAPQAHGVCFGDTGDCISSPEMIREYKGTS